MKKMIRGIPAVLLTFVLLVFLKNQYGWRLLRTARYGLVPLVENTAFPENPDVQENGVCLFMGSSLFRQGLEIREMDPDVYILSYNGLQPAQAYLVLQYLLDRGVSIRRLYLDLTVETSQGGMKISDPGLFLDTDLDYKIRLFRELKDSSDHPVSDLWEMMVLSNNEKIAVWPLYSHLMGRTFERGGTLSQTVSPGKDALDSAAREHRTTYESVSFQMGEPQALAIHQIAALCRENGIPLTYIGIPEYSSFLQDKEYRDLLPQYCSVLEQEGVPYVLTQQSADVLKAAGGSACFHLHILQYDPSDPVHYVDIMHMSSAGRSVYTSALMPVLHEMSAGN